LSALAVSPQKHIDIVAVESVTVLEVLDLHASPCGIDMHLRQQDEGHVPAIYRDEEGREN
jgi:hypothetical protein